MNGILVIDKPEGMTSHDVVQAIRKKFKNSKAGHLGTLDPMATAKIEDLILHLKNDFTIVIVTHNMQQAARISDYTAFFYLGELIEYDITPRIFTKPGKKQTEDYVTGRFG